MAKIRKPAHLVSRRAAASAQASARCSQLSQSNSTCLWWKWAMNALIGSCAGRASPTPSMIATGTSPGSPSSAKLTSQTPSANARRRCRATCIASLVLPTPPTPVKVTDREDDNKRLISAASARRPTRLVTSIGRLSTATLPPPPRSWFTVHRCGPSRP